MKKTMITFLFLSFIITINAQIDYSIFLQKKISKKDRLSFTNLSKFKKHLYSKCIEGDCKNGKSVLKITFLLKKVRNYKIIHTVIIKGDFKNKKLNGEAEILYYPENYYNEVSANTLFSNSRDVLAETKYHEYFKANFINNVATKGEYNVRLKEKVWVSKKKESFALYRNEKTILMNYVQKPDFTKYFSDWDYDKLLLVYKYKGNFPSLSILNSNQFENLELQYYSLSGTNINDEPTITIKPSENENTYTFTQKLIRYKKTTLTKPKAFVINNSECDGCWLSDMTLAEHKQYLVDKSLRKIAYNKKIEKQRLANKIKKGYPFVNHYISNNAATYYIDAIYRETGCLSVYKEYPTKGKYNFVGRRKCDFDDFFILKDAHLCSKCDGVGEINVSVLHTTTYYTTDSRGNRTYDKRPSRSGYVNEIHSCPVCGGNGIIFYK